MRTFDRRFLETAALAHINAQRNPGDLEAARRCRAVTETRDHDGEGYLRWLNSLSEGDPELERGRGFYEAALTAAAEQGKVVEEFPHSRVQQLLQAILDAADVPSRNSAVHAAQSELTNATPGSDERHLRWDLNRVSSWVPGMGMTISDYVKSLMDKFPVSA